MNSVFLRPDYATEDIVEESGHYLHWSKSKANPGNMNSLDQFSHRILDEMLAFYASLWTMPERKKLYDDSVDLFYAGEDGKNKVLREIAKKYGCGVENEFYLYQQARGLGERLFFAANVDKDVKNEVRGLFFGRRGGLSPSEKLLELKFRFWPPEK